jgi:UDP-N-acetyl-D-galactosamine dehydrogenase|tara:strand:+ start:2133 stop:3365 length:1233 start_codon:yes stop_codon:yes gene_type:complete
MKSTENKVKICVIGLGYVGLPIYLRLSKYFEIIGYDNNSKRVLDLNNGYDFNLEYKKKDLLFRSRRKNIITNNINNIDSCNFYIIAVPTPIYENNIPNLTILKNTCSDLSKFIKKNDIIFFESTVYPGVTEDICGKILEKKSKLKKNKDFTLGYSPERINPGDQNHQIEKINKIVAFQKNNKRNIIINVFNKISKKLVITNSIKEAETAKVIENIQRDLNIGLFNEIYTFCEKLKINFDEVINLASSKWNFVKYSPGLVGGHCLPVDPYYLSYIAKKKGLDMKILLAGRRVNNDMEKYVLKKIKLKLKENKITTNMKILILGESYKPNVGDQRNSIAQKISLSLLEQYKKLQVYDPFIDNNSFYKKYRVKELNLDIKYDVIIQLVNHKMFKKKTHEYLKKNDKTLFLKFF